MRKTITVRGVKRLANHTWSRQSQYAPRHSLWKSDEKGDYDGYSTDKDLLNYESIKDTPADSFREDYITTYMNVPDDDEIYNTDNESDVDP